MATDTQLLPKQTIASDDGGATVLYFDVRNYSVCSVELTGGAGSWTATLYRSNSQASQVALETATTITSTATFSRAIDCSAFGWLALKITSPGSPGTLTAWVYAKA